MLELGNVHDHVDITPGHLRHLVLLAIPFRCPVLVFQDEMDFLLVGIAVLLVHAQLVGGSHLDALAKFQLAHPHDEHIGQPHVVDIAVHARIVRKGNRRGCGCPEYLVQLVADIHPAGKLDLRDDVPYELVQEDRVANALHEGRHRGVRDDDTHQLLGSIHVLGGIRHQ